MKKGLYLPNNQQCLQMFAELHKKVLIMTKALQAREQGAVTAQSKDLSWNFAEGESKVLAHSVSLEFLILSMLFWVLDICVPQTNTRCLSAHIQWEMWLKIRVCLLYTAVTSPSLLWKYTNRKLYGCWGEPRAQPAVWRAACFHLLWFVLFEVVL